MTANLPRTSLLQINGQSLPMPNESPKITYSDVESSDSGQDEGGYYHREVLRFGVMSCTLEYAGLSNADCAYLLGLLQGQSTFQFTFPVSGNGQSVTQTDTRTCYCSNYGAAVMRLRQGIWSDITIAISEC